MWWSKKEEAPAKPKLSYKEKKALEALSGQPETLTSEQETVLTELKLYLKVNGLDREEFDDWYLLRFCRARKFSLDKSIQMVNKWVKAREEYAVDSILAVDYSIISEVRPQIFTEGFSGMDKRGRPVKCERYKQIDKEAIFKIPYKEWIQYNIKCTEELIHEVFPYCSKIAEKRIDEVVIIVDFKGVDMSPMLWDGNLRKYFEGPSEVGQDFYPEILGQLWIINAPWIFKTLWGFVKVFLSKTTLDKVKIYGGNYMKDLHEAIGEDNLPECYGGSVTSWPKAEMPWTDYSNYCSVRKSFFHNDEMQCSDPIVKMEKIDFGADCDSPKKPQVKKD